jgi:hypothetical protein
MDYLVQQNFTEVIGNIWNKKNYGYLKAQKKNTSKNKYKLCGEQIDTFAKSEETISQIWNGQY